MTLDLNLGLSPECRNGKHDTCQVKLWNLGIPCTCECHETP